MRQCFVDAIEKCQAGRAPTALAPPSPEDTNHPPTLSSRRVFQNELQQAGRSPLLLQHLPELSFDLVAAKSKGDWQSDTGLFQSGYLAILSQHPIEGALLARHEHREARALHECEALGCNR